MKLSTKITAGAVVFLLLFSQIFSLWSLYRQSEALMASTEEYEDQIFWNGVHDYSLALTENRELLEKKDIWKTAAVSMFRQYLNSDSALYLEGEETALYNQTPYEFSVEGTLQWMEETPAGREDRSPEKFTRRGSYRLYQEIDGRKLLILIQKNDIPAGNLWIFHYTDVTEVVRQTEEIFGKGILAALVLAALMAVLLTLVTQRLLRHFQRLKIVSEKIAEGDYSQRTDIHTKDEVGEVAASFDRMAEQVQGHIKELDAVNEKQQQLLGSLAHEMKTPMMSVLGYAQTLQRLSLTEEQQKKALGYIESESRRLAALSAKMMELTGLYQADGKMEWKEIDAGALLEKVKMLTWERLEHKGILLETETEPRGLTWRGDPDLLTSVLLNLVENACRVSKAGQTVILRGWQEGFSVEDFGCGIPEEDRKRVTEAFYMVDKARTRKEGGAGLGLAICQEIARAHGGSLEIASTVGKGTVVTMRWDSGLYRSVTDQ